MIKHIGFIMDGNRRYSKKNNLSYAHGYKEGMLQFFKVLKWQVKRNIETTSFYALSLDNAQKRGSEELETIKNIITQLLEDPQFEEYCVENKISLNLRGRYFKNNRINKELLEEDEKKLNGIEKNYVNFQIKKNQHFNQNELLETIEKKIIKFEEKLPKKCNHFVNIALFYSGVDEIVTTTQEIAKKVENNELRIQDIDEELFRNTSYFSSTSPPEIIVRTGDAPRISGFMLFLSAYSEIYLTPKLWPELNEEDLNEIISWFKNQSRNFGK